MATQHARPSFNHIYSNDTDDTCILAQPLFFRHPLRDNTHVIGLLKNNAVRMELEVHYRNRPILSNKKEVR